MKYFKRHWQGALSLKVSFWLNLILLTIAWHFLGLAVSGHVYPVRPDKAAFLFLVHLAFQSPFTLWQTVGVWRSARKKRERLRKSPSAWLAQAVAVLVLTVNHLNYLPVNYEDKFRMAHIFAGLAPDPYGAFEVSTIDNHSIIYLSGGMGFGVSSRVEELVKQSGSVQGIILDSPGGWVYEGRALFGIVKGFGLRTYAFNECSSSCTLAFVAGSERYISDKARIGLHGFVAVTEGFDVNYQQKEAASFFLEQGVGPQFVSVMFETPAHSMWYPSIPELTEAGMITGVMECASFSGELSTLCEEE